jgi:hypothetical protein
VRLAGSWNAAGLLIVLACCASTAAGAQPCRPPTLGNCLVNLRIAAVGVDAGDEMAAFSADEPHQGRRDLNGDGDAFDRVVHVFDVRTAVTHNLALALVGGAVEVKTDGRTSAFGASETEQGADLSGDSFLDGPVIQIWSEGVTSNLAQYVDWIEVSDDFVAFTSRQVGLYDASAQSLTMQPWRALFTKLALSGPLLAATVYEVGQEDLNGDGDKSDHVLHVHDAGIARNLRLAISPNAQDDLRAAGTLVAFAVSELAQNLTDLNGDGDFADNVLHLYRSTDGSVTNLRLATAGDHIERDIALGSSILGARVCESAQGSADANGDGDTDDCVMFVHDPVRRVTINTSLPAFAMAAEDDTLIFNAGEFDHRDINGDGDSNDLVLHVVVSGRPIQRVAAVAPFVFAEVDGHRVALGVEEGGESSSDRNGDGDRGDAVLHLFDTDSGMLSNYGLALYSLQQIGFESGLITFDVSESGQGHTDLNGDGHVNRTVLFVADPFGTIENLGVTVGGRYSIGEGAFAILVDESIGGQDRNGDGDTSDNVVYVAALDRHIGEEPPRIPTLSGGAALVLAGVLAAVAVAAIGRRRLLRRGLER